MPQRPEHMRNMRYYTNLESIVAFCCVGVVDVSITLSVGRTVWI
jgi:hypothetical protein